MNKSKVSCSCLHYKETVILCLPLESSHFFFPFISLIFSGPPLQLCDFSYIHNKVCVCVLGVLFNLFPIFLRGFEHKGI